jgi:hypothetical protein
MHVLYARTNIMNGNPLPIPGVSLIDRNVINRHISHLYKHPRGVGSNAWANYPRYSSRVYPYVPKYLNPSKYSEYQHIRVKYSLTVLYSSDKQLPLVTSNQVKYSTVHISWYSKIHPTILAASILPIHLNTFTITLGESGVASNLV